MSFPVYIPLGAWQLHPHVVLEALAYFIGFRVYLLTRSKSAMSPLQGLQVIAGAAVGAAIGSKLLFFLENPWLTAAQAADGDWTALLAGKTIVGGLLGGLIGVELVKKAIRWAPSTGDDFVLPLVVGMAIGRVGCFLTGLDDNTHGTPTSWPVGFDYGDGVLRHPAQLYEIAFLLALGGALFALRRRMRQAREAWTGKSREATAAAGTPATATAAAAALPASEAIPLSSSVSRLPSGAVFQLFMTGYLLFRFAIEFIKPTIHPYLGMNNIQLACIAGLIYYAVLLSRWMRPQKRGMTLAR